MYRFMVLFPVFLLFFVFTVERHTFAVCAVETAKTVNPTRCKCSETKRIKEPNAVDTIIDRIQKRTNDNYDKPNKRINEEAEKDIKLLDEALQNESTDRFIYEMYIATGICKDADVKRKILLPYAEKIIKFDSDELSSIDNQLHVLSETTRISRKDFKYEKEFVLNRYFHANKMLELWSKATVDMIDGWTMGSELPMPEPYKPPANYKGMFFWNSPEFIEDEEIKKEYKLYLEKRDKVINAKKSQDKLFSFVKSGTFYISYLIELYSQQPYNRKELLDLVEKHKVKGKFKEELLQKVKTIKEK